jgi:hypothetical protein
MMLLHIIHLINDIGTPNLLSYIKYTDI